MYIQKFLILPNAYKGSFSAEKIAQSMQEGIKEVFSDAICELFPVADGGDGTLSIIASVLEGQLHQKSVPGPLGELVNAKWFSTSDNTAVIELAQASGLACTNRLDAMNANTFGTGCLINDAFEKGMKKFILTVGGSASTDGGTGILNALKVRLIDKDHKEIKASGANLNRIKTIDLSAINPELFGCEFTIACDVDNPLYGPSGAAFVFARQKGASDEQIIELDNGLLNLASVLNPNLAHLKGAGAAGGVPYALCCVFGAKIISGFDWIVNIYDLENKIKHSDIVLTGEGALDEQSIQGKACGKILDLCSKYNKKLWIFPAVENAKGYDFIDKKASIFPVQQNSNELVNLEDIKRTVSRACLEQLKLSS